MKYEPYYNALGRFIDAAEEYIVPVTQIFESDGREGVCVVLMVDGIKRLGRCIDPEKGFELFDGEVDFKALESEWMGKGEPITRPDPLELNTVEHPEPLSHAALMYIRDRLEEAVDGYEGADKKEAKAALKDFQEAHWSKVFKGSKPIAALSPATLYTIRDAIRADVAFCKDCGFQIASDYAKKYLDEFVEVDWSRYVKGVDLSKDKPDAIAHNHKESELNPFCNIRYELDEDNNIVDIVADGEPEEAVGMAIHFLGKNCRNGSGDLFTYIQMLTTVANAQERRKDVTDKRPLPKDLPESDAFHSMACDGCQCDTCLNSSCNCSDCLRCEYSEPDWPDRYSEPGEPDGCDGYKRRGEEDGE